MRSLSLMISQFTRLRLVPILHFLMPALERVGAWMVPSCRRVVEAVSFRRTASRDR
jgi:hypothetical protein